MGGIIYYGKYTKDQVERANQIDLEELLRRGGEKLVRSGREMRLESDHSVTVKGNRWYDHATEQGGYALSFVRQHYNMNFTEAMKMLLGEDGQAPLPMAIEKPKIEPKPFALPESAGSMRRVYGYLLGHRKIDRDVLTEFAKAKLVYEDTPYHNAVFVGTDENGIPRHAHKRSTNSDGKVFRINIEGSDPAHSFHWKGSSGILFVFEAPIDKEICNYRKGGNKGFDTIITRLQMQTYLCIADFEYMRDKFGRTYGWGVARYSTPEELFGYDTVTAAYIRSPEESRQRIFKHLAELLPESSEKQIMSLMK